MISVVQEFTSTANGKSRILLKLKHTRSELRVTFEPKTTVNHESLQFSFPQMHTDRSKYLKYEVIRKNDEKENTPHRIAQRKNFVELDLVRSRLGSLLRRG